MNTTFITTHFPELSDEARAVLEQKFAPVARLLKGEEALLTIEVEHAPAEGRSNTPCRLVANLAAHGRVYHAEAVKPTPESAADRVRSELEAEIGGHAGAGAISRSAAERRSSGCCASGTRRV